MKARGKSIWVRLTKLLASLVITFLAAAIGSAFTFESIPTWYAGLAKPFFAPPNWLFGPAWTILYFLMALAFFFAWDRGFVFSPRAKVSKGSGRTHFFAPAIFIAQLALNALWSIIFFGWRNPAIALVEIIVMWISIGLTIKAFYPISKKSAYLLIPYILWVSFATILNASIVALN